MSTELSHAIAGALVMVVGVLALASPVYRNFKEQDPTVDHLKVKHVMIAIATIVLGGLIAANRITEVIDYARSFLALISGGAA